MVTTQSADNVLKSYYLDAVTDTLKTVHPFLAKINETSSDVWGRDVRKVVRYGVNGGIGAGTEEGDLPKSNGNKYVQFVAPLKNLYGTIEISDKAIRASENNEGAFVNLLNDEMDGLVKSSAFNFSRMLFGDGSGLLATVTADSTGAVISVDSTRNFAVGMLVDIFEDTGDVIAKGKEIIGVNKAAKQITISSALSVTDGSEIYVQNSKGLEITGLGKIFAFPESYYGVPRATNSWLNPYTRSSVGAITEGVIQKTIDEVGEASGGKVNFILCSPGVRRALVAALSANRIVDTMELEGGFHTVSFNGIPIVTDRFCPQGTMYLLNTDDFALHQLCDWQWLEGEDGKVLKQIPGKPVYTATLVKYAELLCYRPCGQAMLTGITEA